MKTWMIEAAVVAAMLTAVALATGGALAEWVGAGAVLLAFCHCQVGFRLSEAEDNRIRLGFSSIDVVDHRVECYRWLMRYHIGKEILFCCYFVLHGAWSALVGVAVFLIYPLWRRVWTYSKHTR